MNAPDSAGGRGPGDVRAPGSGVDAGASVDGGAVSDASHGSGDHTNAVPAGEPNPNAAAGPPADDELPLKHPDVQVGHRVRLGPSFFHPFGEVVEVVSRRSWELVRVRHADGREETVSDWRPA